jgi:hypothetical protein
MRPVANWPINRTSLSQQQHMKKLLCLILVLLGANNAQAQDSTYQRTHSFFITWGYNRTQYENTDIHFQGQDFDFTMKDVSAQDLPTAYEARTYLNPLRFTIPQFDFRVGFFLSEKLSVSAGWDHMKYRITRYQRVTMDGTVSETFSPTYAGIYQNEDFDLIPSFLSMEHTNGLNYVRLGVEWHEQIWQDKAERFHLDAVLGLSIGPVFTWTDSFVLDRRYKNWLHLAGWGVSGQLALRFRYKDTFYVQYQHQNGYIDLSDIIFMDELPNRAEHNVKFNERSICIGAQIPIFIGGNPNK